MATQKYREDSRTLMAQARAELASGDMRQASEKGWGATALMLKAIAEQREWDHERHRHFANAAGRLRSEMGKPRHSTVFPSCRISSTSTFTRTRCAPRTSLNLERRGSVARLVGARLLRRDAGGVESHRGIVVSGFDGDSEPLVVVDGLTKRFPICRRAVSQADELHSCGG